jgi:hypothetical protein
MKQYSKVMETSTANAKPSQNDARNSGKDKMLESEPRVVPVECQEYSLRTFVLLASCEARVWPSVLTLAYP